MPWIDGETTSDGIAEYVLRMEPGQVHCRFGRRIQTRLKQVLSYATVPTRSSSAAAIKHRQHGQVIRGPEWTRLDLVRLPRPRVSSADPSSPGASAASCIGFGFWVEQQQHFVCYTSYSWVKQIILPRWFWSTSVFWDYNLLRRPFYASWTERLG